MSNPLQEEQGRLFEVGFNIGILAYLHQQQIGKTWIDFYLQDLKHLQFEPILRQLIKSAEAISTADQKMISIWSKLTLLRGFLGGLNFMREYLESQYGKSFKNVELLYYQCNFSGDNSINTHSNCDCTLFAILGKFAQFVKKIPEESLNNYVELYQKKGEFLKADTLIFWRCKQEYRLLVVDTSNFSVNTSQDNLEFVELIKRQLIQEINYLNSRSIFSRLHIDTGETEDLSDLSYAFASGMKEYFKPFAEENRNKESVKLIQAGSYAYSFYQFLDKQKIINPTTDLIITAIGYTPRGLSSLNLTSQNINLIKNCYEIYRYKSGDLEIKAARTKVFNLIKRQVKKSFDHGQQFVESLLAINDKTPEVITHQETLTNFANTAGAIDSQIAQNFNLSPNLSLRDAHAQLIQRGLQSQETYLFLTGNPGIGKTTAIVEFLKQHLDDGFLFFYISPRIQVNLDILEKFKDKEQNKLCDRRLFCLTTNSHVLRDHGDIQYKNVVNYLAEGYPDEFTKKAVKFVKLDLNQSTKPKHSPSLVRHTEDTLKPKSQSGRTVLGSISTAIYTLIESETSNQIVATVSLQALKKTNKGNTIENLATIFQGVYSNSNNEVIPQEMQHLSRRIKHLFFMIDEITGSESGVEFLHGLKTFCQRYQLSDPQHGFNTKIIVADASIVDSRVIQQHLSDKTPETDKIFFRKATGDPQALSQKKFKFLKQPARVINANSYPAQSLNISYKVLLEAQEFQEEKNNKINGEKNSLASNLERTILADLKSLWEQPGQVLLYIQNKQKLQTLLEKLEKHLGKSLKKNQDYLEVKSTLSEKDKLEVHKYKSDPNIKLILMTSSGSRGLSFPHVKHILVDIPGFQVEQNLMEILQVIYRGRGDEDIDKQSKQLIFYLAQKVIYYPDSDPELARQETILNILNTLLMVKLAMLTRIKGSGELGDQKLLIIPIGGKAVTLAGLDFSNKINQLLELLAQESRLNPDKTSLKSVREKLEHLLSQTKFSLYNKNQQSSTDSYLIQLPTFHERFSQAIQQGFDQLLDFGSLESSYLAGSLIIVPIDKKELAKSYQFSLMKILKTNSQELLAILYSITNSEEYHDNLRYATGEAIDLIKEIEQETKRTLYLDESSEYEDQYYALPLFTLLDLQTISEYLPEDLETENTFKKILTYYLKSLYYVYNILPIGSSYEKFPFILFRSYSLKQMRQQVFKKQYLFNSSELNIVNLILSH